MRARWLVLPVFLCDTRDRRQERSDEMVFERLDGAYLYLGVGTLKSAALRLISMGHALIQRPDAGSKNSSILPFSYFRLRFVRSGHAILVLLHKLRPTESLTIFCTRLLTPLFGTTKAADTWTPSVRPHYSACKLPD